LLDSLLQEKNGGTLSYNSDVSYATEM